MKNSFFSIVAFIQIIFLVSTPFFAATASASKSAKKGGLGAIREFLGNDVGLDKDDYFQGVNTQKKQIPEVSINFTKVDGKNYTAVAQVSGLRNINDAYYTWYIKNDKGDDDPSNDFDRTNRPLPPGQTAAFPRSKYMGPMDNLSPLEKMERYKIAAVRAHIDSKFDYLRFDSEFNNNDISNDGAGGTVGDGDGFLEEIPGQVREFPDEDTDNDGYVAYVGGDNAKNGLEELEGGKKLIVDADNYCYLYDRTTGDEYELVGHSRSDAGDGLANNPRSNGGFSCGESDPDFEPGGEKARWEIECWDQEITVDSCPAHSVAGAESANLEAVDRTLYSCNRTVGSAVCINSENPFSIFHRGSGRCTDGGSPVCVPIPQRNVDEPDPNSDRQRFQDYLDYRETISAQCFEPAENPAEIQTLIALRDAWRDAVNTSGEDSPEAEAAREDLDAALRAFLGDDGDVDGFELDILDVLLLDNTADGLVDPNSFLCLEEPNPSKLPTLPIHDVHKNSLSIVNVAGGLTVKLPVCVADTCINTPDFDGKHSRIDDDRPDGFYSCGRKTNCNREIHMFPGSFGAREYVPDVYDGIADFATGDGEFGLSEEEFWGTNPLNASSVDADLNDEMVVTGKGLMEFTWEYREGDEIGVVVEGIGINATRHDSQHPQTVFAFMKDGCKPEVIRSYFEQVRNRNDVEFKTADMGYEELSKCLLDNFVSPGNVTENQNFDLELNGPSSNVVNGRNIPVYFDVSVLDGQATSADYNLEQVTLYNWRIDYAPILGDADSGADDIAWQPYLFFNQSKQEGNDDYARRLKALDLTAIKGVGLDKLDFSANFIDVVETDESSGAQYHVRVTVEVNAPTDTPGVTRFGRASHVFTISNQEKPQLIMGRVALDGDDEPFVPAAPGRYDSDKIQEICTGNNGSTIDPDDKFDILCETVKNEIITFEIPESGQPITDNEDSNGAIGGTTGAVKYPPEAVSWRLNGRRITCDPSVSDLCTKKAIIFVPTTDPGEIHSVTATYVDPSKTTSAVEEFHRNFKVVQPEIFIEPYEDSLLFRDTGRLLSLGAGENGTPGFVDDESTSQYVLPTEGAENFKAQARFEPSMLHQYVDGIDALPDNTNARVTLKWNQPDFGDGYTDGSTEDLPNPLDPDNPIRVPVEDFIIPEQLVNKPVTIGVNAVISTPTPLRKLLATKFDISQFETSPVYAIAEAEIHPYGTPVKTSLTKDEYRRYVQENRDRNRTVFATVFTNTSSYVLLLLKIVLTIGIILFISSVAMPPQRRDY